MDSLRDVLFFLPDLDGGGAQRTVVNLANRLPRERYRATIAAVRCDGPMREWLDDEIELVDLNAGRIRHALWPLRRVLKERGPDILFSTILDANIVAVAATQALITRPQLVLRETNSLRARGDIGPLRRQLIRWAYARADALVALSHGVGRELAADFSLTSARLHKIWNPVDLAVVRQYAAEGAPALEPFDGVTLVAAGRLHCQKGFDILIRALGALNRPDLRLIVLGDGDEALALHELVRTLGLSKNVLFPGFIENPYPWIAAADLFVLSSRWEGFGHVLVEAMACGTAVLSTNCPHGPADIVEHDVDGRLVVSEDEAALAEAISQLADSPELRARFVAAGMAKVERFDAACIAEEYALLFDDLLSSTGVAA
ncbi:MAG: N-acetylgalactosamine-N,N'-diacetylbacillosaminyl-diphospho-undecaprenol 4-alpha-N-acetylgalactosaminyltransferase [Alphaproteobacteria bacterium MarineAlpha4_Bin2]|nr:MAG: N-acetylgalactosamine-N,N'-diacetylbacillosaminyl-diphospho-undecaprenol 4-alpha-N-acetylgalactosaminyltransferase [Alphaproteobacteria bacterium MarineAlpha4_Bin2]